MNLNDIANKLINEGFEKGGKLIEAGEFDPMYPEGPEQEPISELSPVVSLDCQLIKDLLNWAKTADDAAIDQACEKIKQLSANGPLTSEHLMDITGAADYQEPSASPAAAQIGGVVSPVIPSGPMSPVMASYQRRAKKLTESDSPIGWIAFFNGQKVEIPKSDTVRSIADAKEVAAQQLRVPKSQRGRLAIQPGYADELSEEIEVGVAGEAQEVTDLADEKYGNKIGIGDVASFVKAQKHAYKRLKKAGEVESSFAEVLAVIAFDTDVGAYDIFEDDVVAFAQENMGVDLKQIYTDLGGSDFDDGEEDDYDDPDYEDDWDDNIDLGEEEMEENAPLPNAGTDDKLNKGNTGVLEADDLEDELADVDHVANDLEGAITQAEDAYEDAGEPDLEELDVDSVLDGDEDGETVVDQLADLKSRIANLETELGVEGSEAEFDTDEELEDDDDDEEELEDLEGEEEEEELPEDPADSEVLPDGNGVEDEELEDEEEEEIV
jgi:hypothetical protein